MKAKIKISMRQYQNLVSFAQASNGKQLNELQVINIRSFIKIGLKKMIDFNVHGYFLNPDKTQVFNMEINQFASLMALLMKERNFLEPYTLAIFLTIQNQNKSLLDLFNK